MFKMNYLCMKVEISALINTDEKQGIIVSYDIKSRLDYVVL